MQHLRRDGRLRSDGSQVSKRRNKSAALTTKAAPSIATSDPLFMAPPRLWGEQASIYQASGIVYAAMRAITKRFEACEVRFVDAKANPVQADPATASLFDAPNAALDGASFWSLCESYRLYHGGVICVLFRRGALIGPGEFPDTILPFPLAGWTRISADGRGNAFATEAWRNDQLNLIVGTSQCVTVIDPDPSGRFGLVPALATVQAAATTQTQVDDYTSALLRNGGRPGFVLTLDQQMSREAAQNFRSQWESLYGGSYNAGKTAVLDGGKWGLHSIAPMKPGEVTNDTFWRDSVRKVGMAFGVPEFELGITEDANRSSSVEIRAKFFTGTIVPALRLHERAWRRQFFQRLGLRFVLNFNEWSLSDATALIADRAENVGKLIEAGCPRNEAYRINGIPVQDTTWGNTAFLPSSLSRAEDMAKEAEPAPTVAPAPVPKQEEPAKPKEESPAPEAKTLTVKRIPLSMRLKALESDQLRKVAVKAWDNCVAPYEPQAAEAVTKWAKRWKGHFLKRLNHFLKTGQHLDETSEKAKNLSHFIEWKATEPPQIPTASDIVAMMPAVGESVPRLQNAMREAFTLVAEATETQMRAELGSLNLWGAMPPEAHRAIALDRMGEMIQVDETIRRQLQDVLTGELRRVPMPTPVEMASALRQEAGHVFDKAFARAATIARTETGNVMSDYREGIAEAEGMEQVFWSAVDDGHTRPDHSKAEREGWITRGQVFEATGMKYPRGEGEASQVINCRCVALYRLKPEA